MTIEEQAELFSRIQALLLAAKNEKDEGKLRMGAELLNSPSFGLLSPDAQQDLAALYSEALFRSTGALA